MIAGVGILAVTATLSGRHTNATTMTRYVIGFYVVAALVTLHVYVRPPSGAAARRPALASARA
jgi:hypothetical protein